MSDTTLFVNYIWVLPGTWILGKVFRIYESVKSFVLYIFKLWLSFGVKANMSVAEKIRDNYKIKNNSKQKSNEDLKWWSRLYSSVHSNK